MKTKTNLFNVRPVLWAVAIIGLALTGPLEAATNTPAAEVIRSESSILKGLQVYSISFPGGTASEFFKFMRTNGFANDTILFAGRADEVYVPDFTVRNVRLKEVAKSVEFVTEGKLVVEMVEQLEAGDVNIWRVKLADRTSGSQLKTKACALPHLLVGAKAKEHVQEIVKKVFGALAVGADSLYPHQSLPPPGNATILESEKIVVAVGSEAYVEAMASALEAAEKVAASEVTEKK
jgi:hypothetical protein